MLGICSISLQVPSHAVCFGCARRCPKRLPLLRGLFGVQTASAGRPKPRRWRPSEYIVSKNFVGVWQLVEYSALFLV